MDDQKRKESVEEYFQEKEEDPSRVRGLTKIKNLLIDFENDSDFVVQKADAAEKSPYATGDAKNVPQSALDSEMKDSEFKDVLTKDIDVKDIIAQSKNLLFDLKLIEENK